MGARRALEAMVSPRFWEGKRVFLTGHTGFKGSWLATRLLDLGATVSGYALAPETTPNAYELLGLDERVDSTLGDIRDAEALAAAMRTARPDVVIHLAAQPLVRKSYRDPKLTFETNVLGTINVFEALRAGPNLGSVLIVTSDKTYANRERRPQREDDPLGGADPYSASKACAELVTAAYRASFFTSGPRVASARAGNVLGGGDWSEDRLIPDLVRASTSGVPVRLRYPAATRPWQHVVDAIDGYLTIIERLDRDPLVARGWNIGPHREAELSVRELARRFLSRFDPSTEIVIEKEPAEAEAPFLALDASDARKRLGWQPRFDLDATIEATARWYIAWRDGEDLAALTRAQLTSTSVAPAVP